MPRLFGVAASEEVLGFENEVQMFEIGSTIVFEELPESCSDDGMDETAPSAIMVANDTLGFEDGPVAKKDFCRPRGSWADECDDVPSLLVHRVHNGQGGFCLLF